jgi:hypothetical protein
MLLGLRCASRARARCDIASEHTLPIGVALHVLCVYGFVAGDCVCTNVSTSTAACSGVIVVCLVESLTSSCAVVE